MKFEIWTIWSMSDIPWKSGPNFSLSGFYKFLFYEYKEACINSAKIHARLHTSNDFWYFLCPNRSSGALYHLLPMSRVNLTFLAKSRSSWGLLSSSMKSPPTRSTLVYPKSHKYTLRGLILIKIFDGFISLCIKWQLCIIFKLFTSCLKIVLTSPRPKIIVDFGL